MTAPMFHAGERAVQRRAGTERFALQVGRHLSPVLREDHIAFLAPQPFLVIAAQDGEGRVWASPLVGGAGFVHAPDERHLLLDARLATRDPLSASLGVSGTRLGVIALEPDTRTRVRVNGTAHPTSGGILLEVEEAFVNCPQYIQRRVPTGPLQPSSGGGGSDTSALDPGQISLVGSADTFFIASVHSERGADASHRGGRPGFVQVTDTGALRFPDYSGNRMFQTLGNLTVDPRVGLLFLDWSTGTVLQLSGIATIVWDPDQIARPPGAERLIDVAIHAVHQHDQAMPVSWQLIEPWPRQPTLP